MLIIGKYEPSVFRLRESYKSLKNNSDNIGNFYSNTYTYCSSEKIENSAGLLSSRNSDGYECMLNIDR